MFYKDNKVYDNLVEESRHIFEFNKDLTEKSKIDYYLNFKYGELLFRLVENLTLKELSSLEIIELSDKIDQVLYEYIIERLLFLKILG